MPIGFYGEEDDDSPQAWADKAFSKEHEPMTLRTKLGRGVQNPKPVTLDIIKAALHRTEPVDVADDREPEVNDER